MRVLWVHEVLSAQTSALACSVQRQPDIHLDIMVSHALSLELEQAVVGHVLCRSKLDFNARRVIRKQMELGKYDIVHAYTSRDLANVIGACKGLPAPPLIVGYRGTVSRLSIWDPANWITFWNKRVHSIVCVCNGTKHALEASGIPAHKLEPIWEGCNPESVHRKPRSMLTEFGIPEHAFVVGTVANVRPVKGIDIMLQSAIDLAGRLDIYWLVVGAIRDPLVERLAKDPRLKDRLKFAGLRANGGEYAGLFDIYAAPSRKEGLSMGIMEAMTQGCCPVVTNVGGNPELIRHEIDGLVIPPEDPAALSQAIEELYFDAVKRVRLGASALQRVQEVFSIDAWTNRLCRLYRRIAATRDRSADLRVD